MGGKAKRHPGGCMNSTSRSPATRNTATCGNISKSTVSHKRDWWTGTFHPSLVLPPRLDYNNNYTQPDPPYDTCEK